MVGSVANGVRVETEPLSNLRGAKLGLDARRVGVTLGALALVGIVVLVVSLFVAGAVRNSRVNALRQHGVPMQATVTSCIGLLGGSGSNGAGYVCYGTIAIDGRSYAEALPGNTLYARGAKVSLVAVPSNPGLIALPASVASDRASWRVFILPSVLLLIMLVCGAFVVARQRMTLRA